MAPPLHGRVVVLILKRVSHAPPALFPLRAVFMRFLSSRWSRLLWSFALLASAPTGLLAQLVPQGKEFKTETFGQGGAFGGVMTNLGPLCTIIQTFVFICGSIGILWSFWNLFKAAKSGGMGGNWRLAIILLLVSVSFIKPKGVLEMFGLSGLVTEASKYTVFSCILQ